MDNNKEDNQGLIGSNSQQQEEKKIYEANQNQNQIASEQNNNINILNINEKLNLNQMVLSLKEVLEIFQAEQTKDQILPIMEFIDKMSKNLDQIKLENTIKHFDFKHNSLQCFGRLSQYAKSNISSPQLQHAYNECDKQFPFQVLIRGDGNCFYRSIMINYMFKIIIQQNISRALNIFQEVLKIDCMKYKLDNIDQSQNDLTLEFKLYFLFFWLSQFIGCIKILGQQKKYDLKEIEKEYNKQPFVDASTVVICRNIILNKFNYLLKDPHYCFFIAEESQITSPKYLLQYGQEAEDVIIPIAAKAFQVDLKVQNLYRINSETIFTDLYDYSNQDNEKSEIASVIFTQGHYNCLFEKEFYEKNNEKFIWPEDKQIDEQEQQEEQINSSELLEIQQAIKEEEKEEKEEKQEGNEEKQEENIKNKNLQIIDQQIDEIFNQNDQQPLLDKKHEKGLVEILQQQDSSLDEIKQNNGGKNDPQKEQRDYKSNKFSWSIFSNVLIFIPLGIGFLLTQQGQLLLQKLVQTIRSRL